MIADFEDRAVRAVTEIPETPEIIIEALDVWGHQNCWTPGKRERVLKVLEILSEKPGE